MNFFTFSSLKQNCSRLLVAAILLVSTSVKAQTWSFRGGYGASGADKGTSICTDASGNVYIAGSYASSAIVFGSFSLSWTAANDVFVAKFNSSGVAQWAIPIASAGNDFATGIATDGSSVYITGTYANTLNVNGTGGYTTSGGNDGYVVKLNASTGATTWVTTFGGASNDAPQSITLDPSGNVYVSGNFLSAPANFGSFAKSPTGGSGTDMFVIQLNSGGTIAWAATGGSSGNNDNAAGSSLCYIPALSEVVAVGGTNSVSGATCTYGGVSFASVGGNDIVLLEISSAGVFVSGKVVGGTATEDALGACYDSNTGDIFLAGYYGSGSITFGSTTLTNSGSGTEDIFYARYNASTDVFTWAKTAGANSTGSDRARAICADGFGGIIIAGVISPGTANFPTASTPLTLTNTRTTGGDPFLVKVDGTTGNAAWAQQGSTDVTTTQENAFNSVSFSNNNVWATGVYTSNITFGALGALASASGTSQDVLLAKLIAPPPLTATQSQVNLTCNGICTGSATVVASGGTAPYTYSWSPSGGSGATASSLCAINYTVTITDAASTSITKTFSITQPTAINITTISQTNVGCNGGSNGAAQVSASGGTGTLTYNWTPGNPTGDGTGSVTGLTAQVYTVTVTDANSCTATRNFTITQPPAINVSAASQTNVSCFSGNNGAASVSVSGGTPGYSYNWTPGNPSGDGTASVTGLSANTYTCTVTDANGCTGTHNFTITAPTAVSGTTVVTNVACFGSNTGAINLTPTGGTPGYTFDWLPSGPTTEDRTALIAGTYTVQITDANGCTGTVNATVTQPTSVVSGTTVVTNVACFGGNTGAINLTPTGGVGPYTENWLPSGPTTEDRTGLTAGTYTVQITDVNGCTGTVNATVTQPTNVVSGTTVVTNVACFGGNTGAINLTPTGGTSGYTFNWLPSGPTTEDRTGLVSGTYTVQITDANGCTGTVNATVTQPTSPVSGATLVTNVACFGGNTGAINLTPTGGTAPYTENWLPSGPTTEDRTGLTAGTYTVQITDANGCTGTVNATVTQPTSTVSGATVVTNVACFGGNTGAINLTPTGGTPGYTFNWLPSGPTTEDRTGLVAGTYTVQITDANGCTGTVNATVTQPTNVVSGTTVVTNVACFGGNTGAINLTPTGGTPGYTFNWLPSGPTTEDRTSLVAGTYTVQITDANGCTGTVNATVTQPTSPVSGATLVTNVACFGGNTGAINLTPTGGTAGYTFNWLPSGPTTEDRTGLVAGTYTVQITDANGCTGTVNATVTQPTSPVSGTTVVTNAACAGASNGAINLTPSGGTPGYTFNWLPSGPTTEDRTGLIAGTYTVQITDANGCTGTVNATVTEPPAVGAPTASSNTPVCTGNTINLSTPAVSGATYSWTGPSSFSSAVQNPSRTSATVAMAGTYSVTVTVGGCTSAVGTTAVVVNPTPATPTASSNTPVCTGNTINLSTATVAGATYSWTGPNSFSSAVQNPSITGATAAMAGTYSVTVTTTGCTSAVGTTAVVVNSTPATPTASSNTPVCTGNTINLSTATVAGATYSWTGPASFSSAVQNPSRTNATVAMAGTYSVTVTTSGCTSAVGTTAVVVNPTPATPTASSNTPVCTGNTINLSTSTVSGATYSWTGPASFSSAVQNPSRTNATVAMAGTYSVTVTTNGCTSAVGTTAVVVNPTPATPTASSNSPVCAGNTINLSTSAVSGATYSWTGPNSYASAVQNPSITSSTTAMSGTYSVTVTTSGCTSAAGTVAVAVNQSIALVASQTNVSCHGGSTGAASVTATGGSGTLTYDWAPGTPTGDGTNAVTGLTAGSYTVTVTDATTCSATATFNITEPPAITATIVHTDATCNGVCNGSATITPTGGTPGYTYNWVPTGGNSATATGLCPGTYTCSVTDANGCTFVTSVTITQPTPIVVTATSTNVSCNGVCNGTATVTASGGTPGYTYNWSPTGGTGATATGLCPGTYTCNITDANGCTATQTATITEPPALTASVTSTNVTCNAACNGTAAISVSGGTPGYTYNWLPSGGTAATASGLCAGTYTCTATDANGCTITQTVTITEPAALTVTLTSTNVTCNGACNGTADVTVSGGTPAYTYTWMPGGSTVSSLTGLCAGTYTCTITDANGCTATQVVTITEPPVLTASSTATTILCNGGTADVTVSATGGTMGYSGTGTVTVNAGTYTYTVTDTNGCTAATTITITEPAAITGTQAFTVCAGQSVTVGSNTYNSSGVYTDVLPAFNSCDSTVTTTLTVLPANAVSQTITVCPGGSVMVGSNTYTASGTYTDVLTALNSCDSTVTTNLTVLTANTASQTLTVCAGQSVTVGSSVYDTTGTYTDVLVSSAGCDSTLTTNLTVLPVSSGSQTLTVCAGQSIMVGSAMHDTTGIYTDVLTGFNGCDSTVTTNLTVLPAIDVTVTVLGNTLTASTSGGAYQWLDCDNGNTVIAGETNQSYLATVSGDYAVAITVNGCTDTSACTNIVIEGIADHTMANEVTVYPNPASEMITVQIRNLKAGTETVVSLYDGLGKLVYSAVVTSEKTQIDLSKLSKGIYFVKLQNETGVVTKKITKE